ncbi:MAG: helix-turn-helix transcriptional regulator [Pyrinomonadaceae bacterium]|nr:helix-turn-helix transcriptional regulator [Pyrinomonadaceae bacterium]
MDSRIALLKDVFSNDLARRWTIEDLSDAVNISPERLRAVFKRETGMAPLAFLRALRLEKARTLLEDRSLRIKEIRCAVGMPDASHFTKDFKKRFGAPPTEYRRNHWETHHSEQND